MANVEPIHTEEDYEAALARIYELFHSAPGTPESDELESLVDLVEEYEDEHYPIDPPSPSAALEFHIDQTGTTPTDLDHLTEKHDKVS